MTENAVWQVQNYDFPSSKTKTLYTSLEFHLLNMAAGALNCKMTIQIPVRSIVYSTRRKFLKIYLDGQYDAVLREF